jgi:hypothetical protein
MLSAIFPGNESVAVIYPAFEKGQIVLRPLALMENPRAFASSVFRHLWRRNYALVIDGVL